MPVKAGVAGDWHVFSPVRLIRAMARVCCNIRSGESRAEEDISGGTYAGSDVDGRGKVDGDQSTQSITADSSPPPLVATPRWMFSPTPYSLPRTDEGVIIQALYVVLTPLLNDVEEEWHKFFSTHFNLHESGDGDAAVHGGVEECLREVLLEWGYGDTPEEKASLTPREDIQPPEAPQKHEEGEDNSTNSHQIKKGSEGSCRKLSSRGASLLTAALHLHSLLTVHSCCCLKGPPAAGKTTVWRVSNGGTSSLYVIDSTVGSRVGR